MILMFGDVHGNFDHVLRVVDEHAPKAIILLGDVQAQRPMEQELADVLDKTEVWFIHGNHDTDSQADYNNLFGSALADRMMSSVDKPDFGFIQHIRSSIFQCLHVTQQNNGFRGVFVHHNTQNVIKITVDIAKHENHFATPCDNAIGKPTGAVCASVVQGVVPRLAGLRVIVCNGQCEDRLINQVAEVVNRSVDFSGKPS